MFSVSRPIPHSLAAAEFGRSSHGLLLPLLAVTGKGKGSMHAPHIFTPQALPPLPSLSAIEFSTALSCSATRIPTTAAAAPPAGMAVEEEPAGTVLVAAADAEAAATVQPIPPIPRTSNPTPLSSCLPSPLTDTSFLPRPVPFPLSESILLSACRPLPVPSSRKTPTRSTTSSSNSSSSRTDSTDATGSRPSSSSSSTVDDVDPATTSAPPCISSSSSSGSPASPSGVSLPHRTALSLLQPLIEPSRWQRLQAVAAQRTVGVCTVIEGLADPGNVSAVCRTADALGFLSVHVIRRQARRERGQQQQQQQQQQQPEHQQGQGGRSASLATSSGNADESGANSDEGGGRQAGGNIRNGEGWQLHKVMSESEGESERESEWESESSGCDMSELEDGWSLLKEMEENGPMPLSARKRRRARRSQNSFRQSARVVAGADKWLHVSTWEDTSVCLMDLKEKGYRIAVTVLSPDTVPIYDVDWTIPTAVLMGNEKAGVSPEALSLSDLHVSIPMHGMVQSFNISVAAAITLHHIHRARLQALGRQGDLSPHEQEVLLAHYAMRHVGGHRGGNGANVVEHMLRRGDVEGYRSMIFSSRQTDV